MNGHSKQLWGTKSKSIDFADLCSPCQIPKPIPNHDPKSSETKQIQNASICSPIQIPKPIPNHGSKSPESKQIQNTTITKLTNSDDSFQAHGDEDGVGEIFGVILSRNRSVSSTSSQKFMAEKQKTTLGSAVKRALSLRRSSSVSEGYCRIHNQCDTAAADDCVTMMAPQKRSLKKRGNILKACRRFFGF